MKPLVFCDFHGCNVIIRDNGMLCEGRYIKAHGQYITKTPMKIGQSFVLEFCGTGIVKFNTFARKCQAEDWVRSRQPLAKGCKRIRIKGRLLYAVSIPKPGKCVLVESIPNNGKSRFTLEAGPETTLAFDIECGDVVVSMLNSGLSRMYDGLPLVFDSFCHSQHVKITTSEERSSATLLHYNPSSLCCLDNTPLVHGAMFRLEVEHSRSSNTGSYIRICVARQVASRAYENTEAKCWGTTIKPCYTGKRLILSGNSDEIFTEIFTIEVLQTGLAIYSCKQGKVLDNIYFPEAADNTLWFELHRVSARVYENDNSHTVYQGAAATAHDVEGAPSSLFLLPPPPPPPPLARLGCRQRKTKRAAHSRHCSPSSLGGICSRGYLSETSSSDAHDRTPPVCGRNKGTHISTPSLHLPRYINSMPCTPTPGWHIPSKNHTRQYDRLLETDVDASRCITCRTNLISLVSVESSEEPHSQRFSPNQNFPHSHYEKPDPVWLRPKHKCAAFQNECRGPNSYPLKEGNDKCMHTHKLIRKGQMFPEGTEPSYPIQSWDANFNSGSSHTITQGTLTQHSGELQDSVPHKQIQDKFRLKMCERWVQCVNSSRYCWLSQESDTEDELFGDKQCRRRTFEHSRDPVSPEINCNERIRNRQSNGSAIPTSSVWIPETLGYESVEHNLEIEFVPAQGNFRAHSYDSQSFASNSPIPFQHTENSGSDNNNQEITLKKLYYEPTEASAENVSTWSDDSETCTKSVDSGGFDVGRKDDRGASCWTSDASDSTPCMKLCDQEQNGHVVVNLSILHSAPAKGPDLEKNLPKPCRYQPWSELVSSQSPPLFHLTNEKQKYFIYDSNGNKFVNESETEDSSTVDEDDDDEFCGELNEKSQDAMTLISNNESEKENELNERAIDSDSGVVSLRNHSKNPRRNIIDSNISNSSHTSVASSEAVCLSMGPTVKLPTQDESNNATDPAFKRTDTLKRNLDTSPRPSLRKTCSTKTKSLDFDHENETESIGSKPFAEFCTNISALLK